MNIQEMDPEPDECKAQIGKSMRELGFEKINYQKQEKMDVWECAIYYSNVHVELYTTESYVNTYTITIAYHERSDVRLVKRVREIMKHVEKEFVNSHVFPATTFIFGQIQIEELGTSYRAEIPCTIREEINHD